MRSLLGLAIALALPLAAVSAGPPEPDLLSSSRGGALHTLDESGAVKTNLLPDGSYNTALPAWSPDGSRFAFVDTGRRVLVVGDPAGGVREAARPGPGEEWLAHVAWVTPAEVVLYRRAANQAAYSLWLVSVADGGGRLLVDGVDANVGPLPQPGGSLLVFRTATFRHAAVDVRSGTRTLLPEDLRLVAWSPDGRLLAAATRQGLDVMRPDGSDRRTVVSLQPLLDGASRIRALDWAPDGTRLALVLSRDFPELRSRFGVPRRDEIHSVPVGGGPLQQLTGVAGDDLFAGGSLGSVDPKWWPNGARLFLRRALPGPILMMNADGSCETPWPGPESPLLPLWRPGAAVTSGPLDCTSIVVRARGAATEVSFRGTLRVRVTLFNDGTRPLRDVRLLLQTTRGTLDVPGRGCGRGARVVCAIDELPPGRGTVVAAAVRFTNTGSALVTASASYRGTADADPLDDRASVTADVSPCHLLGTWGSDRLVGSERGELICGRPGGDSIDGRGGDDTIDAGSGADAVVGGRGRDRVDGGGGTDRIVVRDGERDVVDCGSERDVVVADRLDVVRRCERVRRR